MLTVTHAARACRNAATAAALSIIDRITPPKTCPRTFASCGIISSEVSCWLSLGVRAARGFIPLLPGSGERGAGQAAVNPLPAPRFPVVSRTDHLIAIQRTFIEGASEGAAG